MYKYLGLQIARSFSVSVTWSAQLMNVIIRAATFDFRNLDPWGYILIKVVRTPGNTLGSDRQAAPYYFVFNIFEGFQMIATISLSLEMKFNPVVPCFFEHRIFRVPTLSSNFGAHNFSAFSHLH
jgi:hypothetical protein